MPHCPKCAAELTEAPHICTAYETDADEAAAEEMELEPAHVFVTDDVARSMDLESSSLHDAVAGSLSDDAGFVESVLTAPVVHASSENILADSHTAASWPSNYAVRHESHDGAEVTTRESKSTASHEFTRHATFRAWSMLAMTAYASATTLLLAWLFSTGRVRWNPKASRDMRNGNATVPLEASDPVPELPRDHVTRLRKSLRVGELEVTPIEFRTDRVWLRNRTATEPNYRTGGSDCLWMRLRVRNVSMDQSFAPLEAEFVRTPDQGRSDSLITTETGTIPMFPLASTSEWVLEGEEFPSIGPGEEREIVVISAPQATRQMDGEMTWRLRVRVAAGKTTVIGVQFTKSDIEH